MNREDEYLADGLTWYVQRERALAATMAIVSQSMGRLCHPMYAVNVSNHDHWWLNLGEHVRVVLAWLSLLAQPFSLSPYTLRISS